MNKFTLDIDLNSRKRSFIEVGELINCSPIKIPIGVIRGRGKEPKLLVIGGVHGEEIGGIEAVGRLYNQIEPTKLNGTLILIPSINIPAFTFRSRFYPLAWKSGDVTKLEKPETSLCGRIGHALLDKIIEKADYMIDLHTTRPHAKNYPWIGVIKDELFARSMELAGSTGMEIIEIKDKETSWSKALVSRGIPNVTAATGEGQRIDFPHPEILMRTVKNVMKYLEMLEGTILLPEKKIIISKRHEVYSKTSGILHIKVKPGDYVLEGDLLAEITDFFNILKEKYISPVEGIIGRVTCFASVGIGDRICKIYETDRIDWKSRKIPELEKRLTRALLEDHAKQDL